MQVKAVIVYHNIARPEKVVSKLFEIDHPQPFTVDEELHLDEGEAQHFIIRDIETEQSGIPRITMWITAYGMDEAARFAAAVAAGWTAERP